MTEGNGRIEQGRFEGKVLEALETLKQDVEQNHNEHRRLYDKIEDQHDETMERVDEVMCRVARCETAKKVTAAKVSGAIVGLGLIAQGVWTWLTQ